MIRIENLPIIKPIITLGNKLENELEKLEKNLEVNGKVLKQLNK